MKLNGKTPGLNRDVLVLEREDGDYVFTAEAVSDLDEFHKLCPMPEPPSKIMRGGRKVEDTDAPAYLSDMDAWTKKQGDYYIIKSLSATEGLVWDKVKMDQPGTWKYWQDEMRDAGMSDMEIMRIQILAIEVNSLSENKLKAARDRFFQLQRKLETDGDA